MNCKIIRQKINDQAFEQNTPTKNEILEHIEACSSCKEYLEETHNISSLFTYLQNEPILKNPMALTNSILEAIENEDTSNGIIHKQSKLIQLFKRTLAAASISLLVIFGVEHYMVFDKISRLEASNTIIAKESKKERKTQFQFASISMEQIQQYKNLFKETGIANFKQILKFRLLNTRLKHLNQAYINPSGMLKLGNTGQITFNQLSDSLSKK